MRQPKFLSPSAITLFYTQPEEYYMKYLAEARPPRFKQTVPMGVGSAFDAYVKAYLSDMFGDGSLPSADELFELQVEEHNRDVCRDYGIYLFIRYRDSGALADLADELSLAGGHVRFETTVTGTIRDVPILGKPDIYFEIDDVPIIFDWKVNGFLSNASPKKGYLRITDMIGHKRGKKHADAQIERHRGLDISSYKLEEAAPDWARQMVMYAFCEGVTEGSEILVGIDQIVCRRPKDWESKWPKSVRSAVFRSTVSHEFQERVASQVEFVWGCIQSGWIFRDISYEESIEKQAELERRASFLADKGDNAFLYRG